MSIEAVARVMRESRSRLGARLVMICLANHDAELGCFASVERIAKESNMSVRQVQRCIQDLERLGELAVNRQTGPNGTNRYTFLLPQPLPMGGDNLSPVKMSGDNPGPEMSPEQEQQTIGVSSSSTPLASVQPTSLATTSRASDPIFEELFALDAGLPYSLENRRVLTEDAAGVLHKATKQIRDTGISPEELHAAIAAWPTVFPHATATAAAVKKHLPRLRAAANGLVARHQSTELDEAVDGAQRYRDQREAERRALA